MSSTVICSPLPLSATCELKNKRKSCYTAENQYFNVLKKYRELSYLNMIIYAERYCDTANGLGFSILLQ